MSVNYGYPEIVTNGLVLHLDAANPKSYISGSTSWNDLSGNRNNGTLTNGPTYSSANYGSIVFDGTNNYIGLGTPTSLNILGNISINSWVKLLTFPTLNNVYAIYEKGYDNINEQTFFRFLNNAGTQTIDIGTFKASNNSNYLTTYNIGSSISTGSWNNIFGQYDGTSWNIYLNGTLVSTTIQNQGPLVSSSPVSVGAAYITNGYQRFLNGSIAILQVYNRALSASEILQNYNALKQRYI